MVKVYAVVLALGTLGLLVMVLGGAFAENLDRPERNPAERFGLPGKMAVGGAVGFGTGGISAEFSPLDLSWPAALAIAIVAGALSVFWVRYAVRQSRA